MAPNIYSPDFEHEQDEPGFRMRDAWIAHRAGAKRLGAGLYELYPNQASFEYHWHTANEEMLVVLSGTVTLRTPDGERQVGAGEVVAFPRGRDGAHQMINDTDRPVRFIVFSEMRGPDINGYPDTGKLGVREEAPGSGLGGIRLNFLESDGVDYWHGAEPPREQ
jgi:uncharacterized cupin superfamily protein